MRFFKNIWLFSAVFLFSNAGNADVVGGHDRQRLAMLFFAELENYFISNPVTIKKSNFPVTVADISVQKPRIHLYDVLSEEGWLFRQTTVTAIDEDNAVATRAFKYELTEKAQADDIVLGRLNLITIQEMNRLERSEERETGYQVSFSWLLSDPAPWIWAPILSGSQLLSEYTDAINQPKRGSAFFFWQSGKWILRDIELSTNP